jgi:hypothetical protein
MKAYLINPFERTVTIVEYDGELDNLRELIGCQWITAPIIFENEDTMYCDDEGMYNQDNKKGSFMMKGWSYPIVGKILVVGANEMGESVDVKTPIKFFEEGAIWVDEYHTTQWINMNT